LLHGPDESIVASVQPLELILNGELFRARELVDEFARVPV